MKHTLILLAALLLAPIAAPLAAQTAPQAQPQNWSEPPVVEPKFSYFLALKNSQSISRIHLTPPNKYL